MSYAAIAASLKEIVETVEGIAVVYDYEAKELGQFPAATIIATGHNNTFNDLQANRREYTFAIRLYYRTEDAATAESTMRGIVDDVIEAIETNTHLQGSCDHALPTTSTWGFAEREVPLRWVQINVTARKRVATRG